MAVERNIIIKLHTEGRYVPPVRHLWIDFELQLVTIKGGYIE